MRPCFMRKSRASSLQDSGTQSASIRALCCNPTGQPGSLRAKGGFQPLRIASHTDKQRARAAHRIGLRREPERIDPNSYSSPRTSKGQNGEKLAIQSRKWLGKRLWELKTFTLRALGLLAQMGVNIRGRTNDPHRPLVRVQEGPVRDVFTVTGNRPQFSWALPSVCGEGELSLALDRALGLPQAALPPLRQPGGSSDPWALSSALRRCVSWWLGFCRTDFRTALCRGWILMKSCQWHPHSPVHLRRWNTVHPKALEVVSTLQAGSQRPADGRTFSWPGNWGTGF